MSKPPSLLDPGFRYVPSSATDIRKTFARIRKQMKADAEAQAQQANVRTIGKRKVGT